MDWTQAIGGILQKYSGQSGADFLEGGAAAGFPDKPIHDSTDAATDDFRQVASAAPRETLAGGIAQAFRSSQTPSFPDMVAGLFTHADPAHRGALLQRLLGQNVPPEQVDRTSPDQVKQIAASAESRNPSVVEEVSRFCADHPEIMHAAGALALAVAMRHMMAHHA